DGAASIFPRLTCPRIRPRFPRRRNRIGPPQLLATVCIEGGDEATWPHLTGTARAENNFTLHCKGGHGEEIAALVVGYRCLPCHLTRRRLECDQLCVERAEVDLILVERCTSVHGNNKYCARKIFRKLVFMLPQHAPVGHVNRIHAVDLLSQRRGDDP